MARLGELERGFHRLEVAHFADEDDVRIFTESGAERAREALRVGVQFALVDEAPLVRVEIFDRVFDRQDVGRARLIDPIDHRGQRRRLAAAGRTGDEHQAARPVGQIREHGRQAQLVERSNVFGNQTVDGAERALLVEDIAPEPADAGSPNARSSSHVSSNVFLCAPRQHAVAERLDDLRRQIGASEPLQAAVHAHLRRRPDGQVQVRCAAIPRVFE